MEVQTHGSVRCTAKSSQTGEPCRRWAILGGAVCPSHGGNSPQVRNAARARLQELVHPAIDRLMDLLTSDDERIALAAVKMILDRTVDEKGDPLGLPLPSSEQIEAWITQLEDEANA